MNRPFVACGLMLATVAATSAGIAGTHYLKSRANAAEYKDKCANDRETHTAKCAADRETYIAQYSKYQEAYSAKCSKDQEAYSAKCSNDRETYSSKCADDIRVAEAKQRLASMSRPSSM